MRWLLVVPFVTLGLSMQGTGPAKEKAEGIEGVTGQFVRVAFDRATAGKAQRVTVKAGSRIEVEYTYPIAPPFPRKAAGRTSDAGVVKFTEVAGVQVYPRLLGVGRLAALFTAEKPGRAELSFDVDYGSGPPLVLRVDAEVE
jgi:hypothetical protein